jgi:hypothetical protein
MAALFLLLQVILTLLGTAILKYTRRTKLHKLVFVGMCIGSVIREKMAQEGEFSPRKQNRFDIV